jgi:hypothetical protein
MGAVQKLVFGGYRSRRAGSMRRGRSVLPAMSLAVVLLGAGTAAHANSLTITPTFESSITSLPGAAGVEGAINAAITAVETHVASPNNINVTIDFQSVNTGLGESETGDYAESYFGYYNAFKAVATSPLQLTALASLGPAPANSSSGNPVTGQPTMIITSAEGRNLGFNTAGVVPGPSGGTFDSLISLNTSITNPPQPNNGSTFGLQAVANHEIDEALGIGGPGSTIGGTGFFATGAGDLDLYRYSAPGVRSFSTTSTTSPFSYFSVDGGNTVLTYFNQTAGADYGDWQSNPIPAGFSPQVQDAFATPGAGPALGTNELSAFSAIGYQLTAVPEPATLGTLGAFVTCFATFGSRKRR